MDRLQNPRLVVLPPERTGEVVDVLAEAFRHYPVMRYVIGGPEAAGTPAPPVGSAEGRAYDRLLRPLVSFFVLARVLRNEPVLGVEVEGGVLAGVATLTLPASGPAPATLDPHRTRTWSALGEAARERYERLGLTWREFHTSDPHHHLNMIGTRPAHVGRGVGRRLLDEVHRRVDTHSESTGVSLTTEDPANVELYRHLGYRVTAEGTVPGALRTWGMFRPASGA